MRLTYIFGIWIRINRAVIAQGAFGGVNGRNAGCFTGPALDFLGIVVAQVGNECLFECRLLFDARFFHNFIFTPNYGQFEKWMNDDSLEGLPELNCMWYN